MKIKTFHFLNKSPAISRMKQSNSDPNIPNNESDKNSPANQEVSSEIKCAICLCKVLYPVTLSKCKHTFCFICIKTVNMSNRDDFKCPMCRAELDVQELTKVKVDDKDKAIQQFINNEIWLYQSNDKKGFWIFDKLTNQQLIILHRAHILARNTQAKNSQSDDEDSDDDSSPNPLPIVRLGAAKYAINFDSMTQHDVSTGCTRTIFCVPIFDEDSIKQHRIRGIAGVYFTIKR